MPKTWWLSGVVAGTARYTPTKTTKKKTKAKAKTHRVLVVLGLGAASNANAPIKPGKMCDLKLTLVMKPKSGWLIECMS